MNHSSLRFGILMTALAVPLVAFAAAPGNVSGIEARLASGQITISWDAPGGDVAEYRVYYGQRSILANDGAYDDFITTTGNNTSFIMTDVPPYPEIFFSVLAANGAGDESQSFIEEVRLDLANASPDGQKTQDVVASPSRKKREAETLGLLSAGALSSRTIELTFTETVRIPVELAPEAFTVMSENGTALPLRRLYILGKTVTITTDPQTPGMRYAVRANGVIAGEAPSGGTLPMDAGRSIVTFPGFSGPDSYAPPVGAVTEQYTAPAVRPRTTPSSGGLPGSGLPILGTVMAGGAVAGWKRVKKLVKA